MVLASIVSEVHLMVSDVHENFSNENAINLVEYLRLSPKARVQPVAARYKIQPQFVLKTKKLLKELKT